MSLKIDDIFNGAEGGVLTLEQFQTIAKEKGANFVDLSGGDYVGVKKHDSEIAAKDSQIQTLNDTIKQRDDDLGKLQKQLQEAGSDAEKLTTVSADLAALQTKYDSDTKAFQEQLSKQAREFAIKEYAASKKFSSKAAKRDYIESMKRSETVKLNKDGVLKGLSDFDEDYSKENTDAFIMEDNGNDSEPNNNPDTGTTPQGNPLPMFVGQTQGEPFKATDNDSFGFSFAPQKTE